MPVFVPAVKLRRSRRKGAQSTPVAYNSGEEEFLSPVRETASAEKDPVSEEGWIKRNLRAFYTEFDIEKERSILKSSPPTCWRAALGHFPAPMDAETGTRHNPTGMDQGRGPPLSLQQGNPVLIPNGVEKSFKSRRPFINRQRDVEDILRKHPHKIPIIVERSKSEKYLGILDKSKFLVPEELTMSQLTTIIRRRLQLTDTQAFYLMVNRRSMASASTTLTELYAKEKDKDGFLYITYASQEMFG